ncbi:hypothetical protein ACOBQX_22320 [Actinokineospora sp. G85]|uniref:hypothetical protein n=1 Tax=Actinokineospora sp. G85 TaxID=3406626 RepID=UPI003C78D943
MSTGTIVAVVVAAVVVLGLVGLALWARPAAKRKRLRERFGPEYERAVAQGDRRTAERDLDDRVREHDRLEIKELAPASRERYTAQWQQVQERFVDRPSESVTEADQLVTALMAERGYPTDGSHEDRARRLSVEHAGVLDHFRAANEARGDSTASTERLREAMVHYRALFADLLGSPREKSPTGR